MSLLEFPPLNSSGKPYAIQEFNGRILSGSLAEFQAMAKCESMSDYPFIERAHLNSLQHSISKNNLTGAFVFREADQLSQALDRWKKDGIVGVIDYVADITEDGKLWPVAHLSRGVVHIRDGFARIASRLIPSLSQDSNWLRCVAVHDEGRRLAICQNNDYIRVYSIGRPQRAPSTLRHPLQTNVTCMAWEPFDQRVLAVAVSDKILIWRLNTKGANINQIIWDRTTTNAILATSPNSGKIMVDRLLDFEVITFHIVDVSTGEVDSFGAWSGGNITNVVPTADGQRLVVLYTGNIIRYIVRGKSNSSLVLLYDRSTWREERWSGLAGRAVSAVWSPTGCCLLFSSENSHQIYSIAFSAKNEVNEDGIFEAYGFGNYFHIRVSDLSRWIGDTHAIPVFDLSPVEFDPSEVEIEGAVERFFISHLLIRPYNALRCTFSKSLSSERYFRAIVTIGGKVHCMTLSPDGQRLAISFADITVVFSDNPGVVAVFIVDWLPTVRLTPASAAKIISRVFSGFVEAPMFGCPSIIFFLQKFNSGSMLTIVWSDGCIQYLPLIYGPKSSLNFNSRTILDEISDRSSPGNFRHKFW
ncbi:unnamed protein product [Angiostrongylus costaricensis]|uniref:WD_REPEATS_REGION domain-containing protein n=1 Tax=Angiostrongylus costaricensis TaxID=334426 RepID=A0A0R3PSK8_ANGCS|nr:unnamed protein product [Angiostrongylus costaricensis]